jgi:hypothetical protein
MEGKRVLIDGMHKASRQTGGRDMREKPDWLLPGVLRM